VSTLNQSPSFGRLSSPWGRTSLVLCCSLLLLVVVYWPTVLAIVSLWRTSTFSHGFLIIPISAYVVWRRRERLKLLTPAPTFRTIPVLALLAVGWLFAELTTAGVVQQMCLMAMAVALVWGSLGSVVTRTLLIPLAFLFFAVPLGDSLVPKLQDFSAWFAVKILDVSGVPVLLEGRVISVPWGKWEVAEACSGLRYLLSSIAAGFLFAGLAYKSWLRRLSFLIASAVVPILANGIRIYGIVLLGHLFGNHAAASVDHVLYGWVFFTIVMLLLFSAGNVWREKTQSPVEDLSRHPAAADNPSHEGTVEFAGRGLVVAFLSLVVLSLAPAAAKLIGDEPRGTINPIAPSVPLAIAPWTPIEGNPYNWKPNLLTPDAELIQSYERDNHAVTLCVAYYGGSQQHTKLVSSWNSPFDGRVWLRMADDELSVTVPKHDFMVHETFVRSTQHDLVIWNWYWIDGRFTNDELIAKLLLGKARFQHEHEVGAAVAIATEYSLRQGTGIEVLKDFMNHISLEESLPTTN
jgi:exosortase A